ncbi:acyl-CoA N-acyltransferase [Trametes versicolor FP-101664 SS1]|uniref:acyl-CoA N-acyltransferase n=1 Tax=Trametes versicolor (strain FP-101664) TaxID=717944 RepID=UPI00046239BC|nr:acyl-CoA N-acyltransferase [Trametes versicolor FP-101664 SS1]EIW59822.1 acyl-CoA N-acyltransferase [Trametes versicolor FP-101664 SS1]
MAFVNHYTGPQPDPESLLSDDELYGPDPYDINFAFPLHLDTLETARVKLVPFVPRVHAEAYWENVKDHRASLYAYYPRFWHSLREFLTWNEVYYRRNPVLLNLAVIDKTRADPAHPDWGGSLAGLVGLINTSAQNLQMEPGWIMVFPRFQHTHVAKEMIAASLRYILQLPTQSPPGLGFRRAQWIANALNKPSVGLAERMGFKREGTIRHNVVLPEENTAYGNRGRPGDPLEEQTSRDTAILSLCWDDWENGERERVEALIA